MEKERSKRIGFSFADGEIMTIGNLIANQLDCYDLLKLSDLDIQILQYWSDRFEPIEDED